MSNFGMLNSNCDISDSLLTGSVTISSCNNQIRITPQKRGTRVCISWIINMVIFLDLIS